MGEALPAVGGLHVVAASTECPLTLRSSLNSSLHAWPEDECTTLKVELQHGAFLTARACPPSAGHDGSATPFAVPIHIRAPGERLALLTAVQLRAGQSEVREVRQFVNLNSQAALTIDLRDAPASSNAAPTGVGHFAWPRYATVCRCKGPSYLEMEVADKTCLPSFLALARLVNLPTCEAPTSSTPGTNASTQTPSLLLLAGAACFVQTAALAAILLRWRLSQVQLNTGSMAGVTGAAHLPQRSMRDACTSPLVAPSASPLVLRKPAEEACTPLGAIIEGDEEQAAAVPNHERSPATLAPAPIGWTR